MFRKNEDVAKKCLEWIDNYGDLDGDGLQECQTRSDPGYENMGWKMMPAISHFPAGTPVKGPKALCELQGYTYDAWQRMAQAFEYFYACACCLFTSGPTRNSLGDVIRQQRTSSSCRRALRRSRAPIQINTAIQRIRIEAGLFVPEEILKLLPQYRLFLTPEQCHLLCSCG